MATHHSVRFRKRAMDAHDAAAGSEVDDDPVAAVAPVVPMAAPTLVPTKEAQRRERKARDRLVSVARQHASIGVPAVGTLPAEGTPETTRLEARYGEQVTGILHGALTQAQGLCAERARLDERIARCEIELAEAEARATQAPGPDRARARGEEHLGDGALADRRRRERARAAGALTVEIRNRRIVLGDARAARSLVAEKLESLADRTLVAAESARHRALAELADYIDELVRHHRDGDLLARLTWPAAFAPEPEWVLDPDLLRRRLRVAVAPVLGEADRA